ncbi:MAG: MBL fold metallo-hydrolase [Coriobacteriales bacterium]|jgi:glyoxylase-like metal-dependent hydrolase (beta-lactamase superfamily II)|nr:MBL fold metallo-hydrolase [Coriobacteriales bacterium]
MNIQTLPLQIGRDLSFTTNCYIVSATKNATEVVVIDPADKVEQILAAIRNRKVAAILLTHRHDDHTGAAGELVAATKALVYAHEQDRQAIEQPQGRYPFYSHERRNPPKVSKLLAEGDIVCAAGLNLKVLHTPGHSAGSICFYSDVEKILFSGDTLFCGTCGRTDFASGSPAAMHDSLQRLSKLPPDTKVLPGHDSATTIGAELNRGLSEY